MVRTFQPPWLMQETQFFQLLDNIVGRGLRSPFYIWPHFFDTPLLKFYSTFEISEKELLLHWHHAWTYIIEKNSNQVGK